jgi:hypothetical protein
MSHSCGVTVTPLMHHRQGQFEFYPLRVGPSQRRCLLGHGHAIMYIERTAFGAVQYSREEH